MSIHGLLTKKSSKKFPTKYIFVSGGVLSGLGKGITAASLGVILKEHGYRVTNIKCENYLNIDSGNINPTEHGDVFLCEDGLEADLDLGSYERFLGEEVGHNNFTTMGQIYSKVIENTKNLEYGGKTVDALPYVPEEAIKRIKIAAKGYDIILIELGGTAGEYQNMIYYEAYRTLNLREPNNTLHLHLTYFPRPSHINELKSKPTQLSVRLLNSMGVQPDFIIGRAEEEIDEKRKEKVAYYCNLNKEDVISNPDCETIYQIPLIFKDQNLDVRVLEKLGLPSKKTELKSWKNLVKTVLSEKKKTVKIAIIAKYIATGDYELKDSYHSLLESLEHAGWYHKTNIEIEFVHAEKLEKDNQEALDKLKAADGIVVPIGWGSRGVEGKIKAIEYARVNKVPYLGLCYGMQLASVEYARNVVGLNDAHTTEVDEETSNPIIHDIPFNEKYQRIKGEGASMRLGAYDCVLKEGSLAHKIYKKHKAFKDEKKSIISERHRHRFEFNNKYREVLENAGFVISGTSPDDFFVEMIELPQNKHPFFIATQAHPEYKSRPLDPHPMFVEYIGAVLNTK
ncbi:MAG: CTP synthase [Candidatus Pacebacteria bacterium]|nr:CTP synthase [Candidatus Paceibacterota bacterium]